MHLDYYKVCPETEAFFYKSRNGFKFREIKPEIRHGFDAVLSLQRNTLFENKFSFSFYKNEIRSYAFCN